MTVLIYWPAIRRLLVTMVWYEARNAQPAAPPFLLVGMRHDMSAQDFNETGWLVREVVQTRVSEAVTTAFTHPMAGDKVQERSRTHHVRGV